MPLLSLTSPSSHFTHNHTPDLDIRFLHLPRRLNPTLPTIHNERAGRYTTRILAQWPIVQMSNLV
jgi:hypothetical protein